MVTGNGYHPPPNSRRHPIDPHPPPVKPHRHRLKRKRRWWDRLRSPINPHQQPINPRQQPINEHRQAWNPRAQPLNAHAQPSDAPALSINPRATPLNTPANSLNPRAPLPDGQPDAPDEWPISPNPNQTAAPLSCLRAKDKPLRNPEGFHVNSRGRQPTVGQAIESPALEGAERHISSASVRPLQGRMLVGTRPPWVAPTATHVQALQACRFARKCARARNRIAREPLFEYFY